MKQIEIHERDDVVEIVGEMGVITPETFGDMLRELSYEVWECVSDDVYEVANELASDAIYNHDMCDQVNDEVRTLLRDYKTSADADGSVCNTGLAFEEAIVACIRRSIKKGWLGSSVLQDIQTGVNEVSGVRISRLEKQVGMLLEIFTHVGERCASVTPTNDNQIRIEEVRDSE